MMNDVRRRTLRAGAAVAAVTIWSAAAAAQLKIGAGAPYTGPVAVAGVQMKNGVELAAADINAAGGVNGQKIEIVFGDDVADPKQGVSVANRFVGENIKFVIGHMMSGVTMPASEIYAENGMLMITPSATNPAVTERKLWNVFRTCGRDDQQGVVAAQWYLANAKGKKIAVVHDKTTYGKGLADEMVKAFVAGGQKEVLYEGINVGEKDFSALISKIKGAAADYVFWGGLHTEGGLILRQMRDQGVTAALMGGDGLSTSEFLTIAGPSVEGAMFTSVPDMRKSPTAAAVVKRFADKKQDPEAFTLYAYAGVELIAQAANKAKSLDPKKVAETLRDGTAWKTVIGDLTFDAKGDLKAPAFVLFAVKKTADGKFDSVQQ